MLVAGIDASTTATGVAIMMDGELLYYELIAIDSKKEKDAYTDTFFFPKCLTYFMSPDTLVWDLFCMKKKFTYAILIGFK